MRTREKDAGAEASRLTTAIMSRSQTIAKSVSRVVSDVRASHMDDAFLATERGMGYRCNEDPAKKPI